MRHRKRGRRLGRSSSHRKAMLRNLASSLILTEREVDDLDPNPPRHKGRVVTTLQKAKEVRSLVEKCITIARHSLQDAANAKEFATDASRDTDEWKQWRKSERWQQWAAARAPVVAAQRRALRMLGDREAVNILFGTLAPRYEDRDGGYTRVLRLAQVRLGDAGTQAILEFVGRHDRVTEGIAQPAFSDEDVDETTDEAVDESADDVAYDVADDVATDDDDAATAEDTADEAAEDADAKADAEDSAHEAAEEGDEDKKDE